MVSQPPSEVGTIFISIFLMRKLTFGEVKYLAHNRRHQMSVLEGTSGIPGLETFFTDEEKDAQGRSELEGGGWRGRKGLHIQPAWGWAREGETGIAESGTVCPLTAPRYPCSLFHLNSKP